MMQKNELENVYYEEKVVYRAVVTPDGNVDPCGRGLIEGGSGVTEDGEEIGCVRKSTSRDEFRRPIWGPWEVC